MAETDIESYLRKKVEAHGGKCWKWVSPGRRGVPDRIVIMPGGVIAFVETKSPGKTERADQIYVQGILRKLGCPVYSSVNTKDKVDETVRALTISSYIMLATKQMMNRGDAK